MIDKLRTPLGNIKVVLDFDMKDCGIWDDYEIHINPKYKKICQQHTLIHEILHVTEYLTGQTLKECQVDGIAIQLLYIIKNNPELIRYLNED